MAVTWIDWQWVLNFNFFCYFEASLKNCKLNENWDVIFTWNFKNQKFLLKFASTTYGYLIYLRDLSYSLLCNDSINTKNLNFLWILSSLYFKINTTVKYPFKLKLR